MRKMQQDRLGGIARMAVAAEADRKIERHLAVERHRRRNAGDLERDPWAPIVNQHIGVNERSLDVLRQGRMLPQRQFRDDVGIIMWKQASTTCLASIRCAAPARI